MYMDRLTGLLYWIDYYAAFYLASRLAYDWAYIALDNPKWGVLRSWIYNAGEQPLAATVRSLASTDRVFDAQESSRRG